MTDGGRRSDERAPGGVARDGVGGARVRESMRVEIAAGGPGGSVSRLLERLGRSAFQGRQVGEAFAAWKAMIDGPGLICLGLAGSLASAGLGPLCAWLVERGYVDLIASTSANVTEDLLEPLGAVVGQVDPHRVDDEALLRAGLYRFYDHVVAAADYDGMEAFTAAFFEHLASTWPAPSIPGVRFLHEFGRWLDDKGLHGTLAATCARHHVPVFVPAAPDGPLAEGYRAAAAKGPVVDFFADYEIALGVMARHMTPEAGTGVIFLGGGVPKDFLQIIATSVRAVRGNERPSPHLAAIQITTDNEVYGGLGGASVATECISWGKEAPGGRNVMVFADVTLALPLICQGLAEHYGPGHVRPGRAAIAAHLRTLLDGPPPGS